MNAALTTNNSRVTSTSNGWSIVVWHPDGAFVAEGHQRWIDAYANRPAFERRYHCQVTIEDASHRNIRSLPRVAPALAR